MRCAIMDNVIVADDWTIGDYWVYWQSFREGFYEGAGLI